MGRVEDKIALITGAAQGLGAETARLLVAEGASVVLTDINVDGARQTADEINAQDSDKAVAFEQDVSSESGWQRTIEATREKFGGLNILVNNAGIGSIGSVEDETLETWQRVHDVDLNSVFLGCKYAIPLMVESVVLDAAYRTDAGIVVDEIQTDGSVADLCFSLSRIGHVHFRPFEDFRAPEAMNTLRVCFHVVLPFRCVARITEPAAID